MTSAIWAASTIGTAAISVGDDLRRRVVEIGSGRGFGAGTIWSPSGLIVTNHHVASTDSVRVGFDDGTVTAGRVVARDLHNDLAVIQVDRAGLLAVERRNGRDLRAGELVMALGHPRGLSGAVAFGVLLTTSTHTGDGQRALIRADVGLAPGNSGGPLADAAGCVIGINAMVGGGLALAVPAHLAENLVQAVIGQRAAA
jgi:serine protease Do